MNAKIDDILLKTGDVCKLVRMSRSTVLKKLKNGSFPKPDHIDPDYKYKYWWRSTMHDYFSNEHEKAQVN